MLTLRQSYEWEGSVFGILHRDCSGCAVEHTRQQSVNQVHYLNACHLSLTSHYFLWTKIIYVQRPISVRNVRVELLNPNRQNTTR